jgi:hypothetical protein
MQLMLFLRPVQIMLRDSSSIELFYKKFRKEFLSSNFL